MAKNSIWAFTTGKPLKWIIAALSAFFLGYYGCNSFLIFALAMLSLMGVFCFGILTYSIDLIDCLINKIGFPYWELPRWLLYLEIIVCFMLGGHVADFRNERAVENYVKNATPLLETEKKNSGHYPSRLPTDLEAKRPQILNYKSDGATYTFSYILPLVDNWLKYDSQSKVWKYDTSSGSR